MAETKKILPQNNEPTEDEILSYINNSLNDEQRHVIEQEMLENDFMNDAIEGLEQFENKPNIQHLVNDLNHQLVKQTTKYKVRKHKRKIPEQTLIIISISIILVLCIIGYWFIKKLH